MLVKVSPLQASANRFTGNGVNPGVNRIRVGICEEAKVFTFEGVVLLYAAWSSSSQQSIYSLELDSIARLRGCTSHPVSLR